jgi:hypothetical protein
VQQLGLRRSRAGAQQAVLVEYQFEEKFAFFGK